MRIRRHRIHDLTVCYDHYFGNTIHYFENGCLGMCEKFFGERITNWFCLVERNIRVNVKSIWVYYLLSGGADILTGDMLLWLSHTDVCSARDEQSGVAVGVVWLWEWCGCGAVMIVRLSLSHTGACALHCVERCGAMVTVGCSALWGEQRLMRVVFAFNIVV